MKKKSSVFINVLRFVVISLAIIFQTCISWVIYFKLNETFIWAQVIMSSLGVALFFFIVNKDQPAVYKLPWVVLFSVFPLGGVVVYLTFGPRKFPKKKVEKINSVFDLTSNEVLKRNEVLNLLKSNSNKQYGQARYITTACNLPCYNNSSIKFLSTGEEFFRELKRQISKAEKYVFFEYFILDDGKMWKELHEIFLEKISKGVKVYLMYDDVGSMARLNRRYCKTLKNEGFNAVRFNVFTPIVSALHNNRDHRKITVVDGKVAITGGANIADEYINEINLFGRWKDSAVLVEGEAVTSFVKIFCQLYNAQTKNAINVDNFICKNFKVSENCGYVLPFYDCPSPVLNERVAENVYLNLINQAENYLYITTPYLVVDCNILDALKNCAMRGVDVRILLPEIPDKKIVSVMTRSNYEKLIESGVKIYEYKGGFIHSKTFVSDGVGVVGTINLDYRSLIHHFENGVWSNDKLFVSNMKSDFLSTVENEGVLITFNRAKQNALVKLLKAVLNLFSPLF